MSTRHFSAERTRRNGASISSGEPIARNRQRRANLATSISSATSSRSIARLGRGRERHRSKTASLIFLDERLGHLRLPELDRERFIKFGKARALEGAGPVTVGIDLGYIKTILSHAAAVHGVVVSTEPIDLARIALGRLGLVGKGDERDRRPTQDELDRIVSALEANIRQQIPIGRII
jgi:hypothetical protein